MVEKRRARAAPAVRNRQKTDHCVLPHTACKDAKIGGGQMIITRIGAGPQLSTAGPKADSSDKASERAGEGGGSRLPLRVSPSIKPGIARGGT